MAVPNAQLADMQITNFAYCDRMLLECTVGVRYETTQDQLRFLLASLRKMLHAHPRIERETVRVRLFGFGSSSIDLNIRVYVETREWNDFFAVREDILLRVYDLVIEAGASFAFPSQTVYWGRDGGADPEKADEVSAIVRKWRTQGTLPFPNFTSEDIDSFVGTLDYPPRGSAERRLSMSPLDEDGSEQDRSETAAEPLSADGGRSASDAKDRGREK